MQYTVRQEVSSDYGEVYNLVKMAFRTTSYSDGTEADYLNDVRKKAAFVPELSLVAEHENGSIIGQIVLYRTCIATEKANVEVLVLSPISVHPDHFRKNIAWTMIEQATKQAAAMGYRGVFLCGEPEIYQRLGFRPSFEMGIFHKDDPEAQWCLGRELYPGALEGITGTIDIV